MLHDQRCELGEGPGWDAARGEFRWLDIIGRQLHRHRLEDDQHRIIELAQLTSFAAPLSDGDDLLVTEHGLMVMEHAHGTVSPWRDVEADNGVTRSNDARLDRHGGLWFSSMGKSAQPEAGSLYRLYRGEVTVLRRQISIPNAICFSADGHYAWFADTPTQKVMRWRLDDQGFPLREDGTPFSQDTQPDELVAPEVWADFSDDIGSPDGAVIDADGYMWLALWGAGRVARLSPEGEEVAHIKVAANHTTCPAFGGANLDTLLITTATEGLDNLDDGLQHGATFVIELADILPGVRGQADEPLHLR
ncbi:hypothetical protein AR456_02185 [Halomonas huangheensis]|nr:hypothetical protein AR456_02185 [Halomonas huangheensis]